MVKGIVIWGVVALVSAIAAGILASRKNRMSSTKRIAYRAADGTLRRLGVRPHRHPPTRLAASVFRQHQVWVRPTGAEHELESMRRAYMCRAIRSCFRQAEGSG